MSVLCCSFSLHCNSGCGVSSRYPGHKEYFPLSACVSDVRSHLKELKCPQSSVASEKELILLRAGFFHEEGHGFTICPKHRADLGVKYAPSSKCWHPLHKEGSKEKRDRGMNLRMVKSIKEKLNILVPIGAGRINFIVR